MTNVECAYERDSEQRTDSIWFFQFVKIGCISSPPLFQRAGHKWIFVHPSKACDAIQQRCHTTRVKRVSPVLHMQQGPPRSFFVSRSHYIFRVKKQCVI